MVGMLSLLDVLWQIPMVELVKQLPVDMKVKDALTTRAGHDGRLLRLIEYKEANDMQAMAVSMAEVGHVSWQHLSEADLQAVLWADELSRV